MGFFTDAFAQSTSPVASATDSTAQHAPSMTPMFIVLAVIILFYVWLWRNQSKKTKNQRALIEGVTKGDEVITSGGISGRVSHVYDDYISLEVSSGVNLMISKPSIASILPKGTVKQHLNK